MIQRKSSSEGIFDVWEESRWKNISLFKTVTYRIHHFRVSISIWLNSFSFSQVWSQFKIYSSDNCWSFQSWRHAIIWQVPAQKKTRSHFKLYSLICLFQKRYASYQRNWRKSGKQNTPEIIYSHNFLDAFVKTWLITTFAVFASGKSESTCNSQQG